jgi:hypothetical protein
MIDDDDDEHGIVGGMKIGKGNCSTQRKAASVPLCTPQIPCDLTWDRIQATTVGSWRLTTCAMALPISTVSIMTDNRLNSQRIRF